MTQTEQELNSASLFSRVLLVEDEAAHAQLISRALSGQVGDIIQVKTGFAAEEALAAAPVDLAFLDLFLPDTTGFDLLKTIRSKDPNLPVVVMTSSSTLDNAVTAMREGAWDYMVKSFDSNFSERMKLLLARVAEKKRALLRELKLREERNSFWAAVRTAQDGVAVLNRDGGIVFANEAFYNFLRLATGGREMQNVGAFTEVLSARDSLAAAVLSTQLNVDGVDSLWRSELKIEGQSPEQLRYFDLTLSSSRSFDFEQELASAPQNWQHVLWVRDITSRKAQERFQRDILATTTHDLKGPLGAILNCSELLEQFTKNDDRRVVELSTRVGSCARSCISLIDELLSARRIQDGVLVVKPDWHELDEILEDIVLDYMPMAKVKSVTLSYNPELRGLRIYADKLGLSRVIGNLVNNAIKFTAKGGSVFLSAERGTDRTVITVRDTGCGIEAEAIPILFEKYARLEKHSNIAGTGLGLFVAKSITAAHDGHIEVKSRVGEGTSFLVSFPDPSPEGEKRLAAASIQR